MEQPGSGPGTSVPGDEGGDEFATSQPGPEDVLLEREVERFLQEALEQLTDKQRQAVELTTAGDLTREEIAETMGVKPGTVSGHRDKGLRRLGELLAMLFVGIVHLVGWSLHVTPEVLFIVTMVLFTTAVVVWFVLKELLGDRLGDRDG